MYPRDCTAERVLTNLKMFTKKGQSSNLCADSNNVQPRRRRQLIQQTSRNRSSYCMITGQRCDAVTDTTANRSGCSRSRPYRVVSDDTTTTLKYSLRIRRICFILNYVLQDILLVAWLVKWY